MRSFIRISLIIIALLVLYEIIHAVYRQLERVRIFRMAQARATLLDKRLIVVGDPYYGYGSRIYSTFMPNYECGDETVDLTGAPNCPNGVKSDLYEYLKRKPSNSGVIFVSCVLEYVPNIKEVMHELVRVAGGIQNVFVVTVNPYSFAAYFYSDMHSSARQLIEAPPVYPYLAYTPL